DFIKLRKGRNLGLTAAGKYVGQLTAAIVFAILALQFKGGNGLTPASTHLSYVRDITSVSMGVIVFVAFVCLVVVAWSNAVNLTDGLDGLAAGSMSLVLGGYVIITFWQYYHACEIKPEAGCYNVRDPLDLALVCAAGAAACIGFLWWNAAPAKIFMGDTGSLALGGLLAGLSITTRTELLIVIITFWQYYHACEIKPEAGCYNVRDPLDLALVCAAGAAACIVFLWWNAAPAKIFMGDTGSLALGGLLAGLSITTRTELLMVVIGALFVAEAASVVLQVAVFRTTRNRLFKMAPFHHHFEPSKWAETTVIIRFWLLAAMASAVGLGLFYSEYLSAVG